MSDSDSDSMQEMKTLVFSTCVTSSMVFLRFSISLPYCSLRASISLSWHSTSSLRTPFRAVSSRSRWRRVSSWRWRSMAASARSACRVITSCRNKEMIRKTEDVQSCFYSVCVSVPSALSLSESSSLKFPSAPPEAQPADLPVGAGETPLPLWTYAPWPTYTHIHTHIGMHMLSINIALLNSGPSVICQ